MYTFLGVGADYLTSSDSRIDDEFRVGASGGLVRMVTESIGLAVELYYHWEPGRSLDSGQFGIATGFTLFFWE